MASKPPLVVDAAFFLDDRYRRAGHITWPLAWAIQGYLELNPHLNGVIPADVIPSLIPELPRALDLMEDLVTAGFFVDAYLDDGRRAYKDVVYDKRHRAGLKVLKIREQTAARMRRRRGRPLAKAPGRAEVRLDERAFAGGADQAQAADP